MNNVIDNQTRVIIHGVRCDAGIRIVKDYLNKGINLIGGVEAGSGGGWALQGHIPIFDTLQTAVDALSPEAVIIAVPSHHAYAAILDSIRLELKSIICLTGDIPAYDLTRIRLLINTHEVEFLGPNSFGMFSPGKIALSSFSWPRIQKGQIGIISRSKNLAYEAAHLVTENGLGISTAIGLGEGCDLGISLLEVLQRFDQDPETNHVVLLENAKYGIDKEAITFISQTLSKPIICYVPKIENPINDSDSFMGMKEQSLFLQNRLKLESIQDASIPLANNLIDIVDFLKK